MALSLLKIERNDVELFESASRLLSERFDSQRHRVACAMRGGSDRIYLGLHVGTRRIHVCAEQVAMGNASIACETQIVSVVAVGQRDNDAAPQVVSPCGLCREMLNDYAPDAGVLVDQNGEVVKTTAASLLPAAWERPNESGRELRPPKCQTP